MSRRVEKWQYEAGIGWRRDGTDLVLAFDRLDSNGDLVGCYLLETIPRGQKFSSGSGTPIDHYLRGSISYVERYIISVPGSE